MEAKEKEQVMELMISYERKALEKGRKQGMKHIVQAIARKGIDVKEIAYMTELSEEEVKQLIEEV
ncbi:hypothetical protein [Anoxybacillus flavithermus]|nr:hypothetical protein [Anoxybacillus flavithermus]EMT46212.1 putative transposase [Anoxybacillus flavithermus AK1]